MGIKKVKVSELPSATSTAGLNVLGVDGSNQSVKADMELLRGNTGDSAYQLWLKQAGNSGKSYEEYLAYNRGPATEAAAKLGEYQLQVTNELNQLASETTSAKEAAETATRNAKDVAENPTKIGEDHYVYMYNPETGNYQKTDIYVKGDKGDRGDVMFASFRILPQSGELVMTTPDSYQGPGFRLNQNGELLVSIN